MINKIISVLGVLMWLTLMPLILCLLLRDFYAVLFLTNKELYVSYSFGLIPFLSFCILFTFAAVFSLLTNREQRLKSFIKRRFSKNGLLLLIAFTICLGLSSKPFLGKYLIEHGYEHTQPEGIKKSFNKDFFILKK